ncbi:MAG: hypothetical protein ACLTOG_08645 [Mediterraneibacter faecis]
MSPTYFCRYFHQEMGTTPFCLSERIPYQKSCHPSRW